METQRREVLELIKHKIAMQESDAMLGGAKKNKSCVKGPQPQQLKIYQQLKKDNCHMSPSEFKAFYAKHKCDVGVPMKRESKHEILNAEGGVLYGGAKKRCDKTAVKKKTAIHMTTSELEHEFQRLKLRELKRDIKAKKAK